MVFELLLLLFLLYLAYGGLSSITQASSTIGITGLSMPTSIGRVMEMITVADRDTVADRVTETLKRLRRIVDQVIDRYMESDQRSTPATFTLMPTEEPSSWVDDKRTIHLAIRDQQNNRLYDQNTLVAVTLHEVAHVLTPDSGHTARFDQIEDQLLSIAQQLGYYDPEMGIAENYPCVV